MRILAADVGGTKTILALYEEGSSEKPRELRSERFDSHDFPGIAPMAQRFLEDGEHVDRMGIGVAGPVENDTCKATNLPWEVDARRLEKDLGIEQVHLVNDFTAVAYGIRALGPEDLEVLQPGEVDPMGPVIAVGAGTGLGEAVIVRGGDGRRIVLASEGGHVDFAPRNEEEIGLLRFLWKRHRGKRISVERVVSGLGLSTLYDFVVQTGIAATTDDVRERLRTEDHGEVIGNAALARSDPACVKAVDLFISAYGAEVGNFALKVLPTGGIYIAGGIAPRLIQLFRRPGFRASFLDKGRMSPLVERMHVSVIMNTRVGLLGARQAVAEP